MGAHQPISNQTLTGVNVTAVPEVGRRTLCFVRGGRPMRKSLRRRTPKPFEIPALEPLDPALPNWERELMIAALERLARKPESISKGASNADAEVAATPDLGHVVAVE